MKQGFVISLDTFLAIVIFMGILAYIGIGLDPGQNMFGAENQTQLKQISDEAMQAIENSGYFGAVLVDSQDCCDTNQAKKIQKRMEELLPPNVKSKVKITVYEPVSDSGDMAACRADPSFANCFNQDANIISSTGILDDSDLPTDSEIFYGNQLFVKSQPYSKTGENMCEIIAVPGALKEKKPVKLKFQEPEPTVTGKIDVFDNTAAGKFDAANPLQCYDATDGVENDEMAIVKLSERSGVRDPLAVMSIMDISGSMETVDMFKCLEPKLDECNYIGSGCLSFVAGPSGFGNAIYLNGQGGLRIKANPPSTDISRPFTISAWIKIEKNSSFADILSRLPEDNSYPQWYLSTWAPINTTWVIFRANTEANNYSYTYFNGPQNTWFHVAEVYNETGDFNMFINGVNQTLFDPPIMMDLTSNADIYIGNSYPLTSGAKGAIDDVRIYNRALNESEINAIRADPSNLSNDPALMAYLPFETGFEDVSGKENNAEEMCLLADPNNTPCYGCEEECGQPNTCKKMYVWHDEGICVPEQLPSDCGSTVNDCGYPYGGSSDGDLDGWVLVGEYDISQAEYDSLSTYPTYDEYSADFYVSSYVPSADNCGRFAVRVTNDSDDLGTCGSGCARWAHWTYYEEVIIDKADIDRLYDPAAHIVGTPRKLKFWVWSDMALNISPMVLELTRFRHLNATNSVVPQGTGTAYPDCTPATGWTQIFTTNVNEFPGWGDPYQTRAVYAYFEDYDNYIFRGTEQEKCSPKVRLLRSGGASPGVVANNNGCDYLDSEDQSQCYSYYYTLPDANWDPAETWTIEAWTDDPGGLRVDGPGDTDPDSRNWHYSSHQTIPLLAAQADGGTCLNGFTCKTIYGNCQKDNLNWEEIAGFELEEDGLYRQMNVYYYDSGLDTRCASADPYVFRSQSPEMPPTLVPSQAGYGNAYEFDYDNPNNPGKQNYGIGEYLDMGAWEIDPDPVNPAQQGITLAAWINATNCSWDNRIISKAYSDGTDAHYWLLGLEAGCKMRSRLKINGTTTTRSNSGVPLNTWTHLAVTYDGTDVKHYINGVLVQPYNAPGALTLNPSIKIKVGMNSNCSDDDPDTYAPFAGLIDEVRVYNRSLNIGEINQIMADSYTDHTIDVPDGLQLYLPFDSGMQDVSGHNRNGVPGKIAYHRLRRCQNSEAGTDSELFYPIPGEWTLDIWSDDLAKFNDVSVALDRLGSARHSLHTFIDSALWKTEDRMGLISYSNSPLLETESAGASCNADGMCVMDTTGKTAIKTQLNALRATLLGETDIGDAIEMARIALITENKTRFMVLLSDGIANLPGGVGPAAGYALGKANNARADGITVYTIGFGDGVKHEDMFAFAKQACGYNANDPTDLPAKTGVPCQMILSADCFLDDFGIPVKDASGIDCVPDCQLDPIPCDLETCIPNPNKNCGKYYFAEDPDTLNDVYEEIAREIGIALPGASVHVQAVEGMEICKCDDPDCEDECPYNSGDWTTGQIEYDVDLSGGFTEQAFKARLPCSSSYCAAEYVNFPPVDFGGRTHVTHNGVEMDWGTDTACDLRCDPNPPNNGDCTDMISCTAQIPFEYKNLEIEFFGGKITGPNEVELDLNITNNSPVDIVLETPPSTPYAKVRFDEDTLGHLSIVDSSGDCIGDWPAGSDCNAIQDLLEPPTINDLGWGTYTITAGTSEVLENMKVAGTGVIKATLMGISECSLNNETWISCRTDAKKYYFKAEYWTWIE
ncbi:MAG: VWA domain-containing protein [Candidatus Diapherotrites archaeon]|nr:VWA domain-containing protein [Candidatus Diapherotrites archaeon]